MVLRRKRRQSVRAVNHRCFQWLALFKREWLQVSSTDMCTGVCMVNTRYDTLPRRVHTSYPELWKRGKLFLEFAIAALDLVQPHCGQTLASFETTS
jgi:hypothetical protein